MLELVTIFLVTFLISLVAIWFYRKIAEWQGSGVTVVARRKKSMAMKLKPQQGYISLRKPSKPKVKSVRLRSNANGTIKAPWGW
jgi:hypothetical protein